MSDTINKENRSYFVVSAEDCISICQLWSFVPIIEEFQAELVTEKTKKYMQHVN